MPRWELRRIRDGTENVCILVETQVIGRKLPRLSDRLASLKLNHSAWDKLCGLLQLKARDLVRRNKDEIGDAREDWIITLTRLTEETHQGIKR